MFEALQFGPFLFRSYVFFLLLGIILATELFLRIVRKENIRIAVFYKKGIWFILLFLLFGRLFAILLLYRVYVQEPLRTIIFWDGEFSVVGGCVGIAIALFITTYKERQTFLMWLDAMLPPMALLLAFDWFGRFLGALSYGKPTNMPWGVIHESMRVRYTVPVHPVQLYYALWFCVATFLLLLLHKKRFDQVSRLEGSRGIGLPTLLGVLLGCLGVVFLESFRGDFALTVFAKFTDFLFLTLLFVSLGAIAVLERRISPRYSLINSIAVGFGTIGYLLLRPFITVASVEWRFSQFIAALAMIAAIVYVCAYRYKYPKP